MYYNYLLKIDTALILVSKLSHNSAVGLPVLHTRGEKQGGGVCSPDRQKQM